MKKIHHTTVAKPVLAWAMLISAALFASCEKFLDVQPTDALVSDNPISDARSAKAAVIAAYTELKTLSSYVDLFGSMPGDNVEFVGSLTQYVELDNLAFSVTNPAIVPAYRSAYTLVNRANWAIAEVPKVEASHDFPEAEKNHLIGEAYFLRALAYFNLARTWGGVQLQLTPTTDLESIGLLKRSSQADTYQQVKDDLNEAERLLKDEDAKIRDRAQKSSVNALRARVHLYAEEWEQAEQYAGLVIADTNKFELVKPYGDFFKGPFLTKESVFEVNFTSTISVLPYSAGSWWKWTPSAVKSGGSFEYRPTNEIVSLLNDTSKGGTRSVLLKSSSAGTYVALYHTTDATADVPANTDPSYAIRIADLYLIRAEARAKKASPDLAGAIADLNAIRSRAETPLLDANNADAPTVIQAIEDERRLEFAFEAHRWYDLVRTKRAKEVLGAEENYWIFPLPINDVLSDEGLEGENNPKY
jgi:tetratricopeptide (TPR) repeat protein